MKALLAGTFTLTELCKQVNDKFESKEFKDAVKSERIRGCVRLSALTRSLAILFRDCAS